MSAIWGLICVTAEAAKQALGVDIIEVMADRDYYEIEDIEAYQAAHL